MNFSANNTVHKARELETTEWEDILVKRGIVQEREELKAQREARAEARKRGEEEDSLDEVLEGASLEKLDLVEDEVEEDTLERLRRKRIEQLKQQAKRERFGSTYPLAKADFVREVTEASRQHWVVVEMFKDGIQESSKCSDLIRELARRHPAVKFLRIRSTDCVEGWPDSSVPCLFLYHDGKMQKQIIGLDFCGGPEASTAATMERGFAQHGVFEDEVATEAGNDGNEDEDEDEDEDNSAERARTTGKAASAFGNKVSALPRAAQLDHAGGGGDDDDDDDW